MIISLIGMSGVGKSYWSTRLEQEAGYTRICCDDLIGQSLAAKLSALGIKSDLRSIAEWRGLPYEEQYVNNERMQILNEQKIMEVVCQQSDNSKNENIIIDTSGSLVYIDKQVIQRLKNLSKMVYIVAGKEQEHELYNDEVIFHRPLVWGNSYQPKDNELQKEAMRRCFTELISWRSKQYERWASISIPYIHLRQKIKTTKEFIDRINQY